LRENSSSFNRLGSPPNYSVAELKRRLPGFSYADFALEAQTIFKRMNTALAEYVVWRLVALMPMFIKREQESLGGGGHAADLASNVRQTVRKERCSD